MGGTLAVANSDDDYLEPETGITCVMARVPYTKYTGTARNCCEGTDKEIEAIYYDDTKDHYECFYPQDMHEVKAFNNGAGCGGPSADGNVFSDEETAAMTGWADESGCV